MYGKISKLVELVVEYEARNLYHTIIQVADSLSAGPGIHHRFSLVW